MSQNKKTNTELQNKKTVHEVFNIKVGTMSQEEESLALQDQEEDLRKANNGHSKNNIKIL